MFRFTIRELVLLTVVVAMGVGWWLDQDRIRRERKAFADEREKFRIEAQRMQALPLRYAEAVLQVTEAELATSVEVNRRSPGAILESDLRRLELQLDVARLDVEKARMRHAAPPRRLQSWRPAKRQASSANSSP